ncbi:MAG TPA: hypothetical protein H9991_10485 [Candidatus Mailhella excrementigallinarum]|nr:hypothetical protein [Candidatus Mailhella excrementigallinarum]
MSPEEACLSQAIRLPLDVLIDISISYRKAGVEALAADPGDENLQALAVVAENTRFYLELLKKQTASVEKIQNIVSAYRLKTARPDTLRQ